MVRSKSFRYKINISPILDKAWRIRFIQRPFLCFVFVFLSLPLKQWTNTVAIGNKLKWIYCKRQLRRDKKATFTACDFVVFFVWLFPNAMRGPPKTLSSVYLCVHWIIDTHLYQHKSRLCRCCCCLYQPKYNLHMVDYITSGMLKYDRKKFTQSFYVYYKTYLFDWVSFGIQSLMSSVWSVQIFFVLFASYVSFFTSTLLPATSSVSSTAEINCSIIEFNYITRHFSLFHFIQRCTYFDNLLFFCETFLISVSYWLIRHRCCKTSFIQNCISSSHQYYFYLFFCTYDWQLINSLLLSFACF